jgi:hypothetical protein
MGEAMIQHANDFLAHLGEGDREILAHMGEAIVQANYTHRTGPDGVRWEPVFIERSIAYHHAQAALDALTKAGFTFVKNNNP